MFYKGQILGFSFVSGKRKDGSLFSFTRVYVRRLTGLDDQLTGDQVDVLIVGDRSIQPGYVLGVGDEVRYHLYWQNGVHRCGGLMPL